MTLRVKRDTQRGVALIEFAICLPMLMILVLGTVDFGRAYTVHEHVKNAAREGAVYAANFPYAQLDDGSGNCTDPNNIAYRAKAENSSSAITVTVTVGGTAGTPNGTGCDVNDPPPGAGTNIVVKAKQSFSLFTPLVQQLFNLTSISSSVTVRETQ